MTKRETAGKTRNLAAAAFAALFGFQPMEEPALLSGGTPSLDSLGRDTLRLLTWNLHKQKDPSWRRDFDRLLDQYHPDLLHLQEARVDSMVAALSQRPEPWSWMASPNLTLPSSGDRIGAFTAARAPLRQGLAMLSEFSEPLGTRKPMLLCALPVRGSRKPLLCLNIHSLNFSLGLKGFGSQLDSVLGHARSHAGPVIFSGDFNTWNPWRKKFLLERTQALGFRQVAFADTGPKPGWIPRLTVDRVFYLDRETGWNPVSAQVLNAVRSSDHAPLMVSFIRK